MNRTQIANEGGFLGGFLRRLRGGERRASRVARRAGLVDRPGLEPLEARQLLFTLTVTPDVVNPLTGTGTVHEYFGYALPYLAPTQDIQEQEDQESSEDFNDDLPQGITIGNLPPQGFTFVGSDPRLRLEHTITPASDAQLRGDGQGESLIRLRAQVGESFTFSTVSGGVLQSMRSFEMDVFADLNGTVGLPMANMRVTLLFAGEVIDVYEGVAEIDDLNLTFPNQGVGVGRFGFQARGGAPGQALEAFDEIRFDVTAGTTNEGFFIDNTSWVSPAGNFTQTIEGRLVGAWLTLSGPVGASVQVLDLYGREMDATLALGVPQNSQLAIIDRNDDGMPEGNDGIGRLIISNADERTSISMVGGVILASQTVDPDAEAFDTYGTTVFNFLVVENLTGLYDDWEQNGTGYVMDTQGQRALGLPPGPGSVFIGSPYVRDNADAGAYNPGGLAAQLQNYDFARADQGVFVNDGSSMGNVYIHGIVHGSSQFSGAVHEISVGVLPGSVSVQGDLNALFVGSDAGLWVPDDQDSPISVDVRRTNSQLVVGRALGQVHIAGRSSLDITVVGDVSNPQTRPPGVAYRYFEAESNYGIRLDHPEGQEAVIKSTQFNAVGHAFDLLLSESGTPYDRVATAPIFGLTQFRNDTILSAEWVGSVGTAVQIHGDLGLGDPIDTNEDPSDVYAFASDGVTPIVLQLRDQIPADTILVRLLDSLGRTVAGIQITDQRVDENVLRFQPTQPGVYHAVIGRPRSGSVTDGNAYVLTIGGMAPTTLGAYRVAGSSGRPDVDTRDSSTITILNGSMGSVRVGTAYVNGAGGETDPSEVMNFAQDEQQNADDRMMFEAGTITMPGTLYEVLTGGDLGNIDRVGNPVSITVGGDFGVLLTGQSNIIGVSPEEGDAGNLVLNVGGRIAGLDVRGGLGLEQDVENNQPPGIFAPNSSIVTTGRSGGNGDVGFIRVGSHVGGDSFVLRTSPGSTVGQFLVSQDILFTPTDPDIGIYATGGASPIRGIIFNTGAGSDVRFVDFPRFENQNSGNAFIPLVGGQPVEIVDDGGGRVRIDIPGAPNGVLLGDIRVLPVDGSQGVAIGHLRANLTGGLRLLITGLTQAGLTDSIGIGKIEVVGADANSSIRIDGLSEIDVYRIIQTGGTEFNIVENVTPGGDLVSVDMGGLNTLTVSGGDLGRTEVPEWGPALIGPFLGVAGGDGGVGGALGVTPAVISNDWNGGLYRAANNVVVDVGTAQLDDLGSPLNPYLNGLAVRSGGIAEVIVSGTVGDVYIGLGDLGRLEANSDGISFNGRFEGIEGVVFAANVLFVDIGDGLAPRAQSPIATTGIFAVDDIHVVEGDGPGVDIRSTITAANQVPTDRFDENFDTDGIERINLSGGGDYRNAYISVEVLDGFWAAFYAYGSDEALNATGDIESLGGTDADMVRSDVFADDVLSLVLTGGVWDATAMTATGTLTTLQAVAFRNSTRTATPLEFHLNQVIVGRDLNLLETFGGAGDIQDLTIDVLGSVLDRVSGRNLTRVRLDVDNTIELLQVGSDFRGSAVNTGAVRSMAVVRNVAASSVFVSGPLTSLTADAVINSRVEVTGPDGRIESLTARAGISGEILASGPIDVISSTGGDVNARIVTTTDRGNIGVVSAFRDLNIEVDASGTITSLVAGRNVGAPESDKVILVRGTLGGLDVSHGQLFSDLRVGESISGAVTIGGVSNLPGEQNLGRGSIIAFGRIESVVINGDFDADIVSYTGGIGSVVINDGSFLPGNRVAAYEGDLTSLVVNRGHLFGDVYAEFNLVELRVVASDDGVFGDIGVNPDLNAAVSAAPGRNQLPPGMAPDATVQGPEIRAGRNINGIFVTNGSVFEANIYAGFSIMTIDVNGSIRNDTFTSGFATWIVAADVIHSVDVEGSLSDAYVFAGILDLGADNAPGHDGNQANFDRAKFGRVRSVRVHGDATNVKVAAGMQPGTDGVYNTADDAHALGLSFVDQVIVDGAVTNVSAFADTGPSDLSPGIVKGGRRTPVAGKVLEPVDIPRDPNTGLPIWSNLGVELTPGAPFSFTHNGVTGTITFSGPGYAVWDAPGGRLIVARTTVDSTVFISGLSGQLVDFDVVSNDDANLGSLVIETDLLGDSDVVIDGYLREFRAGHLTGTGSIMVGNDIQSLDVMSFTGGSLSAIFVRTFLVRGEYNATANINGSQGVTVEGDFGGVFSMERTLGGTFAVGGDFRLGTFRSGGSVTAVTAATMERSRIVVRDDLGSVVVGGDAFDSAIIAGFDLGRDAQFGGTGLNADAVTTGFIGAVTVGGDFRESDVVAGIGRGGDGFFGTSDDSAADGRSRVGAVTIGGRLVGSNNNSESYRVVATGGVASVTLAGVPISSIGNFRVVGLPTQPVPIRVIDTAVTEVSRVYTARIFFNQPMDAGTLGGALSVSEVRGVSGEVRIRLFQGSDYTLSYDANNNAALVTFNEQITQRNLPQTPGVPGIGIYRFDLDAAVLRAQVVGSRLDGDADGFAEPGDNFSTDDVVGDAGDKAVAETINKTNPQSNQTVRIDAYGPIDLNTVLDDNLRSDGIADTNRVFTVRGTIGDHPDHDVNTFRFAGDVDVYKITLQAGQILRLGPPSGAAAGVVTTLYNSGGQAMGGTGSDAMRLPGAQGATLTEPGGSTFMVRQTGDFFLVVAATAANNQQFDEGGDVPNTNLVAGGVGDYAFTLEVFDDGDSGFAAPTDAGDGEAVVHAPAPSTFAGPDGQFGTPDDLSSQVFGSFAFTLDRGGDGTPDTSDDVVSGSNGDGIGVVRTTGPDTQPGTADDLQTITIDSAIGHGGHSGVPIDVSPDVDVFHLNNRLPIQPGSKVRLTVRLAELGADLGAQTDPLIQPQDFSGQVQMGFFETTGSGDIDDGVLVLAPTSFGPTAGDPGVIADDGSTTYGYDDDGNFFVEFVTPGSLVNGDPSSPAPASYAVYIQGVYNTDYQVEAQVQELGLARVRNTQNIYLETRGGVIDWLEATGVETDLAAFDARALGFTGRVNGQPVNDYIITNLVSRLNTIFAAAGVDVNVSANPAAFEFQPHSTIYLTSTNDPINFFSDEIYGYSQRSDVLNADVNDEGVVFLPTLAPLGYQPSQDEIDDLVGSLAAAVGRRAGELMGLRITEDTGGGGFGDIMADDSVRGQGSSFSPFSRRLSTHQDIIGDTDFYLGQQNSGSLLSFLLLP